MTTSEVASRSYPHPAYKGPTAAEVAIAKAQFIELIVQSKEYRYAIQSIARMPNRRQSFPLFSPSDRSFHSHITDRDLIYGEMTWTELRNEVSSSLSTLPNNWATIIRQVDPSSISLRLEWNPPSSV